MPLSSFCTHTRTRTEQDPLPDTELSSSYASIEHRSRLPQSFSCARRRGGLVKCRRGRRSHHPLEKNALPCTTPPLASEQDEDRHIPSPRSAGRSVRHPGRARIEGKSEREEKRLRRKGWIRKKASSSTQTRQVSPSEPLPTDIVHAGEA